MKSYKCWVVMFVLFLATPIIAKADAVWIDTFTSDVMGPPASELKYIENKLGIDDLVYLAKISDEGWEYGVAGLAGAFGTDAVDEVSGDVWWDLTGSDYALSYILVKDGKYKDLGDGQIYALFSVTDDQKLFSGPEEIGFLSGYDDLGNPVYYPKKISHITFFGSDYISVPPPPQVPEPSTLLLIGTGVLGLGIFGRRKFQK